MSENDALSLVGLANIIMQHRRFIARFMLAIGLLTAVLTIVKKRDYTSTSSFAPQSRRTSSGLSGLAAQFGVALPAAEQAQSPYFYQDLLLSRDVLGPTVEARFPQTSAPRDSQPLWRILEIEDPNAAQRRERGILALRNHVGAAVNTKTGVVQLNVTMNDPLLAGSVNRSLLMLLDQFNQEKRKSQALAERQFTERRTEEARLALRDAEDRMQIFLQHNRDYRNSPELTLEQDRLAREVTMRQQIYSSLAQSYEQARIEEVRDTPVLTLVMQPDIPAFPDPRGLIKKTFFALIGGMIVGILLVLTRALMSSRANEDSDEVARFADLRAQSWSDTKRPWRLVF